jgi:hypothetical protein
MNNGTHFEDRASRSRSRHEGESSSPLCDRLSRTRVPSQRQLPTNQDYAVSTREYQTDQSSITSAPTAAGPVLEQQQKPPHGFAAIDQGHSISGKGCRPFGTCANRLGFGCESVSNINPRIVYGQVSGDGSASFALPAKVRAPAQAFRNVNGRWDRGRIQLQDHHEHELVCETNRS